MFRRRSEADGPAVGAGPEAGPVAFELDGLPVTAAAGDSVAAAMLAAGGQAPFRETAVSGAARAPWCMMGVCFDCLVEIDGTPNRQACMAPVRPGMRVRRQHGARELVS